MDYGFRLALLRQWMTRQSIKKCGNGPGVRPRSSCGVAHPYPTRRNDSPRLSNATLLIMLKRFATAYGAQSPVTTLVWSCAVELGILALSITMLVGHGTRLAAVYFFVGQVAFLCWTLGCFALVRRYEVDYYQGSLLDYLRGRRARALNDDAA